MSLKNLKKIFLILILFLITGCAAEYNLVINDDYTVNESLTMLQPNSFWGKTPDEIEEQIYWTIVLGQDDTEPAYFYDQSKVLGDLLSGVNYEYKFDIESFERDSDILRKCFKNYDVYKTDTTLNFQASIFDCYNLLGQNFDLQVNITAKGKPIRGNYNKQEGNTYTWSLKSGDTVAVDLIIDITNDNQGNINGNGENKNNSNLLLIIGIITFVILLGIIILVAYKKNKDNNR